MVSESHKTPAPVIRPATDADLDAIEGWLRAEEEGTGEGFYANWPMIRRGVEEERTFLMWCGDEAVAVLVDGYGGPQILSVRPDLRRQGLGAVFATWMLARAHERNLTLLRIECQPPTSIPFWKQHGFVMDSGDSRYAHQILERLFALDDGLDVPIEITLFPEARNWDKDIPPLWSRTMHGRRHRDQSIQLPARVPLFDLHIAALHDCSAGSHLAKEIHHALVRDFRIEFRFQRAASKAEAVLMQNRLLSIHYHPWNTLYPAPLGGRRRAAATARRVPV